MKTNEKGIILLDGCKSSGIKRFMVNGNIMYVKSGTLNNIDGRVYVQAKSLSELLIESIASYIYHELNNKSILYRLASLNGQYVNISPDFTIGNPVLILMDSYYGPLLEDPEVDENRKQLSYKAQLGELSAIKKIVTGYFGDSMYEEFINEFISDMFILNDDRHPNNYGCKAEETGKYAPLDAHDFDHSLCVNKEIFKETIIIPEDMLKGSNSSSKVIRIDNDLIKKATRNTYARVGLKPLLIDEKRVYYHFQDLIAYCVNEDYTLGNSSYRHIIESQCDILKPKIILDRYELFSGIELTETFKSLIIQILESRKDDIWNTFQEKARQYKK